MRLVFDTNVLFAAHLTRGTCATLYQEALMSATLLTSGYILDEFETKLVSRAGISSEEAARTRAEVTGDCEVVAITPLAVALCRDADDDAILATAIAARADSLVTGDKDLLVIGSFQGIRIVTPRECLTQLRT